MSNREITDLVGGGFLLLLGGAAAIYAYAGLPTGTPMRMGPGMVPCSLGVILAVLGAAIFIGAWRRRRPQALPQIDWRSAAFFLLAVAVFAGVIGPFGMIPAVILTTLVATGADGRLGILRSLLLALVLAAFTYLLFGVVLGAALRPFNWPF